MFTSSPEASRAIAVVVRSKCKENLFLDGVGNVSRVWVGKVHNGVKVGVLAAFLQEF